MANQKKRKESKHDATGANTLMGIQKQLEKDDFLSSNTVTSSMECTGLIPALPNTEEEAENYSDLYHIPKQEVDQDWE